MDYAHIRARIQKKAERLRRLWDFYLRPEKPFAILERNSAKVLKSSARITTPLNTNAIVRINRTTQIVAAAGPSMRSRSVYLDLHAGMPKFSQK